MQLNDLSPAPGSRKDRKRVGRGHGSGHGGTFRPRRQGPELARRRRQGPRLRGRAEPAARCACRSSPASRTASASSTRSSTCRVSRSCSPTGDVVDVDALFAKGVIKSKTAPVKVLGDGELTKALTVKVDKVSGAARTKIEAAGGTVEAL